MKKMTKNQRSAAEMYALRAITLVQFAEMFRSEPTYRFIAALKYAITYGKRFDDWLANRELRADEIEESWYQFDQERYNNQVALDEFENFCNSEYLWWKEFIEEYEKNEEEYKRKKYLDMIAEDAAQLDVPSDTIFRFFKTYNLTPAERCRFWMNYYMCKL